MWNVITLFVRTNAQNTTRLSASILSICTLPTSCLQTPSSSLHLSNFTCINSSRGPKSHASSKRNFQLFSPLRRTSNIRRMMITGRNPSSKKCDKFADKCRQKFSKSGQKLTNFQQKQTIFYSHRRPSACVSVCIGTMLSTCHSGVGQ